MNETTTIQKETLSQWLDKLTTADSANDELFGTKQSKMVRTMLAEVGCEIAAILGVPHEFGTASQRVQTARMCAARAVDAD